MSPLAARGESRAWHRDRRGCTAGQMPRDFHHGLLGAYRLRLSLFVGSWLLVLAGAGCGGAPVTFETRLDSGDERVAAAPVPAVASGSAALDYGHGGPRVTPDVDTPLLVALGDSLTAGLGVAPDEAYPARLQAKLDAAGYRFRMVNAGVSGDTSAGGLRRLDWALDDRQGPVAALLVALGGNDGLRGLASEQLKENLSAIIKTALGRGIAVLLAGMEAPPNFGAAYTHAFRQVYSELADEHDVVYVPFLLDGVAGVAGLNQSDGIHPNADGAEQVAAHLWPAVESLTRQLTAVP